MMTNVASAERAIKLLDSGWGIYSKLSRLYHESGASSRSAKPDIRLHYPAGLFQTHADLVRPNASVFDQDQTGETNVYLGI